MWKERCSLILWGHEGSVERDTDTETTLAQLDSVVVTEAIQVVSAIPKWTAGIQGGKPGDVACPIPITFEITN